MFTFRVQKIKGFKAGLSIALNSTLVFFASGTKVIMIKRDSLGHTCINYVYKNLIELIYDFTSTEKVF